MLEQGLLFKSIGSGHEFIRQKESQAGSYPGIYLVLEQWYAMFARSYTFAY